MKLIRVYTGEDDAAHFEAIDPVKDAPWSDGLSASNCTIRELAVGTVMDWHPAPRRQLIIHLAGHLEIRLRDGTAHVFGPASVRLMDDITGTGHLTTVLGNDPVVQAAMPLTD